MSDETKRETSAPIAEGKDKEMIEHWFRPASCASPQQKVESPNVTSLIHQHEGNICKEPPFPEMSAGAVMAAPSRQVTLNASLSLSAQLGSLIHILLQQHGQTFAEVVKENPPEVEREPVK